MLEQRKLSQPLGQPSCGSVFRNPPGNFAAKLIEQSNLKGYRIGGAHVSSKHANFIITDERACAKDVEQLIEHIKTIVKKLHDISLICEVKIIGNL
jgi:UDP-N-acetylmuramate dehydrogenase